MILLKNYKFVWIWKNKLNETNITGLIILNLLIIKKINDTINIANKEKDWKHQIFQ